MDGDSGNKGVNLRSLAKRRKYNRPSGSKKMRDDDVNSTIPTVVNRSEISAEDAAVAGEGFKNFKIAKSTSRAEKIKEKYFVVKNYKEALEEKLLEDIVKVLRIENCISLRKVQRLLFSKTFSKRLLASQVFVLIFELDDYEESNNILDFLTKCFQKHMIVQLSYKDTSCLYFNDSSRRFKKLSIALNSNEYLSQIATVEKFNFEFLCNLINSTDQSFGKFNNNIMKIGIETTKRSDYPTLADLTAEKGDLLCLKFLKIFELKFSRGVNSEIVTEAMRYGSLDDFKLTFDFSNSDLLLLAVQSGKLEVVKYLLENNCNITGDNATNRALNDKNFDILLELLLNDCFFPKEFDEASGGCSSLEFQELITSRAQFHKNIKENQIEKIKMFIKRNPKVRHAYLKDNQCALTTALQAKCFEIYSLLRSEGFTEGVDEKCAQTLKALDIYDREEIKLKNRKYFEYMDSNHLQDLIARSNLGFGSGQENFSTIRKYFVTLNKIPEIEPILRVVANSNELKIIFDFNNDSVIDMDPTQICDHTIVRGRTIYCVGNILIGAKQSEDQVLATLAHEMTHLAVHILYDNEGRPYSKLDCVKMEKFKRITDTTRKYRHESEVIENAFKYEEDEIHQELVVRIPQLCAMFRKKFPEIEKFKRIYSDLFQYFDEEILKDCEALHPVMKSQQQIESLNQLLSLKRKIQLFQEFSTKHEPHFDAIFNDNSNLFIQTNHHELCLESIIKSQNRLPKLNKSHLFIEFDQLLDGNFMETIKEIFHSKAKPKLFVNWINQASDQADSKLSNFDQILVDLEINSRVVLIASDKLSFSKAFANKIELFYNWNDLCEESRKNFIKKEIDFQGKKIALKELVGNIEFLTELSIKDVLNLDRWTVKKNFERQEFYVKRNFEKRINNQTLIMSSEDFCQEMWLQKTIVLADAAGTGKSSAAVNFVGKLKETKFDHWVVFIDLNDYTKFYVSDDKLRPNHDYKDIFRKIVDENDLLTNFFYHLFESRKVIFVIDGYDEISPSYSKFVLRFLKTIKDNENHLLVTTRQHFSEHLTKELGVIAISLQSLDGIKQRTLLAKFWSQKTSKNKEWLTLTVHAEALLEKFHKCLGFASRDFFGNPLMIKMLAEVYNDQSFSQTKEINLNLFLLYKRFWLKKIGLLFDKGPSVRSNAIEIFAETGFLGFHHQFALETYFPELSVASLNLASMPLPLNKSCQIFNNIGLLHASVIENNLNVVWTHRSFAEYFVADFIIASITEENAVTKSKVFHTIFRDALLNRQSREVRKFINDKLESDDTIHQTFYETFLEKFTFSIEQNILHHLLLEGQTAFVIFIIKALSEDDIFKFLVFPDSRGYGALTVGCARPGRFVELWPIVENYLDKKWQKELLIHGNSESHFLISIVSAYGSEFDIAMLMKAVLELFSAENVKELLSGQFPGFKQLLLNSSLKLKNGEAISAFWEGTLPNVRDQKSILLSDGLRTQMMLCDGILKATREGILFLLKRLKVLLEPEEIMAFLLAEVNPVSDPSFCLQLVARWRHVEIFKILWDFVETSLEIDQQKIVFLKMTSRDENILNSCIWNKDHRVAKKVFDIARSLLSKDEFKYFLGVGRIQWFNVLYYSEIRCRHFKMLCEAFREVFDDDELKLLLSETSVLHKNVFTTASRFEDPRNLFCLVEMSKSCFQVDQLLSLFGGVEINKFLAVLRMADNDISREMLFGVLNVRDVIYRDPYWKVPLPLWDSDQMLHIVCNYGASVLISRTIKLMQSKLDKTQIRKFLEDEDNRGCNALGRSVMNIDKTVADKLWCLYTEVFNFDEIKKYLRPDSIKLKANIFHLAAVADHPILVTALEFFKLNFSQPEFRAVFVSCSYTNLSHHLHYTNSMQTDLFHCHRLTHLVAKFCSKPMIRKYFDFLVKSLETEEIKQIILKEVENKSNILIFMLENEYVECFRLFWSKMSQILGKEELEKMIFVDTQLIDSGNNWFAFDANVKNLEELKEVVRKEYGEGKIDQRFEYQENLQLDRRKNIWN